MLSLALFTTLLRCGIWMTTATGPKISSRAHTHITLASTISVGLTKQPFTKSSPSVTRTPPATMRAPSSSILY